MTNETNKNTLCLIDGSGYIFRAFYALPPMNRPDGTPTNAVYGFTNMMMNLLNEHHCAHIVVIFDAKRKNFRNDIYPQYKANRRETPPELIPQFPLIRSACEALNVKWLEKEGYEADDLIAAYAEKATKMGWQTTVITADKDLMQLMTDSVKIYDPMKKKMLTEEDVIKKFGVTPDKVTDVQALMGDSTDNIPGANGIGPKTAAELIKNYGSLKNLLANLDTIPKQKQKEGLIRDKEQILISEKLVTLDKNAPTENDLSVFESQPYHPQHLSDFLTQNNFQSLIKKIQLKTQNEQKTPVMELPTQNICIQSETDLQSWLKTTQNVLAITSLTQNNQLIGVALANSPSNTCYIPLNHIHQSDIKEDLFAPISRPPQISPQSFLSILTPFLENTSILKIGHSIKQTWHSLTTKEMVELAPIDDIELMGYILNNTKQQTALHQLSQDLLGLPLMGMESLTGLGKNKTPIEALSLEQTTVYMGQQVSAIFQCWQKLKNLMNNAPKALEIYKDIDLPLIPILYRMEKAGILVDIPTLQKLDERFTQNLQTLTDKIYQAAGEEFNINSPAQLGVILYEKQGLSGGKRSANGHWITDVKVLESLAQNGSELAHLVLQYRTISKLKSTYVDALKDYAKQDTRIHTTFSLTATNTGRLASSDPNLQNIPIRSAEGKEIRQAFKAKPGYKLVSADYSQIELRLMAEVANVRKLKESFAKNEDIHARTASQILGIPLNQITPDQRRQAKAINFGIIYGISAFGLAANLGISRTEAKAYIDTYFGQYPEIKKYMQETEQFAERNGFVTTPFGRTIHIAGLDNKMTKNFALRAAINAPIQGGAADIIKMATIKVCHILQQANLDAALLLQVHDELVFEIAEQDVTQASELIKEAMEKVVHLSVPLVAEVGVGDNWKEAH